MINNKALLTMIILGMWIPARSAPLNKPLSNSVALELNSNTNPIAITDLNTNTKNAIVDGVTTKNAGDMTTSDDKVTTTSEINENKLVDTTNETNEDIKTVAKDGSIAMESINKLPQLNTNSAASKPEQFDVMDSKNVKADLSKLNGRPSTLSANLNENIKPKPLISNSQKEPAKTEDNVKPNVTNGKMPLTSADTNYYNKESMNENIKKPIVYEENNYVDDYNADDYKPYKDNDYDYDYKPYYRPSYKPDYDYKPTYKPDYYNENNYDYKPSYGNKDEDDEDYGYGYNYKSKHRPKRKPKSNKNYYDYDNKGKYWEDCDY